MIMMKSGVGVSIAVFFVASSFVSSGSATDELQPHPKPNGASESKSKPVSNFSGRYKVMSYDAQHDHLNIIDDEQPSTNLHHLDKQPYYQKKSHLLGHRGEYWPTEDRLRAKHQHAKMMARMREQESTKKHQLPQQHSRDRHHRQRQQQPQQQEHYKNKHHGKILPNNPELDKEWKANYLQHIQDLKTPVRKEHTVDSHHQHQVTEVDHRFGRPDLRHPEPAKLFNRKDLQENKKPAASAHATYFEAKERANPYDKRFHKKDDKYLRKKFVHNDQKHLKDKQRHS